MSFDGKAFGKEIVEIVKGYVDKRVGEEAIQKAIAPTLKAIEARFNDLDARMTAIDHQKASKPKVRVTAGRA
jgi:hypothetical protein